MLRRGRLTEDQPSSGGRRLMRNALIAYTLFQHWGNVPGSFDLGTPEGELLDLVELVDWGVLSGSPGEESPPIALEGREDDLDVDPRHRRAAARRGPRGRADPVGLRDPLSRAPADRARHEDVARVPRVARRRVGAGRRGRRRAAPGPAGGVRHHAAARPGDRLDHHCAVRLRQRPARPGRPAGGRRGHDRERRVARRHGAPRHPGVAAARRRRHRPCRRAPRRAGRHERRSGLGLGPGRARRRGGHDRPRVERRRRRRSQGRDPARGREPRGGSRGAPGRRARRGRPVRRRGHRQPVRRGRRGDLADGRAPSRRRAVPPVGGGVARARVSQRRGARLGLGDPRQRPRPRALPRRFPAGSRRARQRGVGLVPAPRGARGRRAGMEGLGRPGLAGHARDGQRHAERRAHLRRRRPAPGGRPPGRPEQKPSADDRRISGPGLRPPAGLLLRPRERSPGSRKTVWRPRTGRTSRGEATRELGTVCSARSASSNPS